MERGWESEIGGARSRIEMVGGDFLSRPRPCMGCIAWEWVSDGMVLRGGPKYVQVYKYVTVVEVTLPYVKT
jgi:hypothetical protein